MTDQAPFERFVAEQISGTHVTTSSGPAIERTVSQARQIRQRPRWLALIKEPPMRLSSRVAVGSPTARLASIALATLLLAVMATGAVLAGASLLAGSGVIVVAQDGSGDFKTITEALAVAEDGDTIMIEPGTYSEAVVIDEDITLIGDGPRDQIRIENPPAGPVADREILRESSVVPPPQFTLLIEDSDASVSGLTVSGPREGGITAIVIGGAPTLDDISIVLEGPAGTWDAWAAMYVLGSSQVDVSGSELNGWVDVSGGSSATFEEVEFVGHVYLEGPGNMSLRANSFITNPRGGRGGVEFVSGATGIFEGNDLASELLAVNSGSDVVIRDNLVGGRGIEILDEGTRALISGNTVSSAYAGITVGPGADATIEGNTITGGLTGLALQSDSVRAESNTITGAGIGISVEGTATPTLTGNSLCDNETDLRVDDSNPTTLDGNEVCPDLATAAPGG